MIRTKPLLIISAFILVVSFTLLNVVPQTDASGTIYYVSTSGSDSNAGTSTGAPLRNISTAISRMNGGDTLRINGQHSGQVIIPQSLAGTSSNPTVIESYGSGTAVISHPTNQGKVFQVRASHVTVRNLTIDGTAPNHSSNETCLYIGQGSEASNIANVTIDGVTVQNCEGQGIEFRGDYINGAPRYVSGTIRNSTVTAASLYTLSNPGMGSGWQSGVKVAKYGRNILIEGNQIINNWGEGVAITRGENVTFRRNNVSNNFSVNIYIDNSINTIVEGNLSYCLDKSNPNAILRGGEVASGITIGEEYYGDSPLWGNQLSGLTLINNISYACSRTLAWYGTDSGSGGLDNALIANNTFYTTANTSSGVYFDGQSGDDFKVYNNVFVETGSGGTAWIDNPTGNYDFRNNYWSGEPYPAEFRGAGDIYGNLGNIGFVSTPSINPNSFKLASNSILIDEGRAVAQITEDYFCSPRSGTPDIGATELGSSGSCTTTSSSTTSSATTTSTSSTTSSTSSSANYCPGDYDKQNGVNISDFTVFAQNYRVDGMSCELDLAGGNCYLDIQDLAVFAQNYKTAACEI